MSAVHSIPRVLLREYGAQFLTTSLIFLGVVLGIPQEQSRNWALVPVVLGIVAALILLPRAMSDSRDPALERAKYSSRRMILWRALSPFLFATAWLLVAFTVSRTTSTYRFGIFGNAPILAIAVAAMAVMAGISYAYGMRRLRENAVQEDSAQDDSARNESARGEVDPAESSPGTGQRTRTEDPAVSPDPAEQERADARAALAEATRSGGRRRTRSGR